ncbi:MAG: hypothetical protein V4719_19435, partial [Planctomycetota bacterium]
MAAATLPAPEIVKPGAYTADAPPTAPGRALVGTAAAPLSPRGSRREACPVARSRMRRSEPPHAPRPA